MEDWRATIAETASRATSYYKAVLNPKAISIFSPFATREPLSTINFLQAVLDFIRRYEPAAAKEGLYSHQATLLKNYSAGAGPNFILTSAIGSGKILCFWAWVIDQLIKHRTATAVLAFFFFPPPPPPPPPPPLFFFFFFFFSLSLFFFLKPHIHF